MFERFTGEAREVVVKAQERATEFAHHHIGTEHLLIALIEQQNTAVNRALVALGLTPGVVETAVLEAVPRGKKRPSGHIPFTPRGKKVLELSLRESLDRGDDHIGPEHLLLALVAEGHGVAAQILLRDGRTAEQVRAAVEVGSGPGSTPRRTPALADVLALAEQLAAGAPLGSHHLLAALTRSEGSAAGQALAALGVTADALGAQLDDVDLRATRDSTPELLAASSMRWAVEDGTAVLRSDHPPLVERVTALAELAAGQLTGEGRLVGPFIAAYRALFAATEAMQIALVRRLEEAPGSADRQVVAEKAGPDNPPPDRTHG